MAISKPRYMCNMLQKCTLAGLLSLALAVAALDRIEAVDLHDVLADYALTAWTQKDGLTGTVWAISQDRDNYLWLGTDDGLFRFDGTRFMSWPGLGGQELPRRAIRALWAARDGSLWIGYEAGGASRIETGRLTSYREADGFTDAYVGAFAEDRSNVIFAATLGGLFRFADRRWTRVGAEAGLPEGAAFTAYVDEHGALLVANASGLYRRPDGAARFELLRPGTELVRDISVDAQGEIWMTDTFTGMLQVGRETGGERSALSGRGVRLVHDHRDNLWVATLGQGLWRVRRAADGVGLSVERASVLTGLSSDTVRALFEDREGNIWAGTSEGLDRLTPHRVTPVLTLGVVTGLDTSRDGRVWVTTGESVMRFSETNGWWETDGAEWPVAGARALHVDRTGAAWVSANHVLTRVVNGRATTIPLPKTGGPARIDAIESDSRGRIWLIDRNRQLFRWDGDRLERVTARSMPAAGWITSAHADRSGGLWLTFTGSRVGVLGTDDVLTMFGPQDGLAAGPYNVVYEDSNHIVWIGSGDGLSWYVDGRFASVSRANGSSIDGVTAIVEDLERQLWLGTSSGIVRLARSKFEEAVANPQHQLRYRLYDTSDGVAGMPVALAGHSAVRASDGRLWFATGRGLTVVDPRSGDQRRAPLAARIEGALADDRRLDPVQDRSLPGGIDRLAIEYTALSLAAPFKTRFRYRLVGFDAEWIEAGTRREAVYTNLPPRDYEFRVATVDDEVNQEHEAVWAFSIEPLFYQTAWFYGLIGLALVGGVAGAWQLRLRQIRRQFALVVAERVRVSRELHDTLLQSLVGVALQVDAVSAALDASPTDAKSRLMRVRRQVEEYIREARQSIWNLRTPMLSARDLPTALRESTERTAAGTPVALEFHTTGEPRPCTPDAEHQLLRIGREAVLNAIRHSHTDRVRVDLQYGDADVRLRVTDRGRGFDPASVTNGANGHYGLTTMRERAEEANGTFTVRSSAQEGTTVEVVVPVADRQASGRGASA